MNFKLLIILILLASLFVTGFYIITGPVDPVTTFLERLQTQPGFEKAIITVSAQYEDSTSLVSWHNDMKIHPGSNYKLVTTLAALHYLGPDFTYSTKLYLLSNGNAVLVGSGDPTLTGADFTELAKKLAQEGKKISGALLYDESYFVGDPYGPQWRDEWKTEYFAVPSSALSVHNSLFEVVGVAKEPAAPFDELQTYPVSGYGPIVNDLTFKKDEGELVEMTRARFEKDGSVHVTGDAIVGMPIMTSAAERDPAYIAALTLRQVLAHAGVIDMNAVVQRSVGPYYGELLYEHVSAPLKDIVTVMLKYSRNHYAEALVRTIAHEMTGVGSQKKGVELEMQYMKELGITHTLGVDGSGLSPLTRTTSADLLELLVYADTSSFRDVFWNALPESQEDGTLARRFKSLSFAQRVIAKTGSHEYASSLSGKITRLFRKDIFFSVHIYNHSIVTEIPTKVIPAIDGIVLRLNREY